MDEIKNNSGLEPFAQYVLSIDKAVPQSGKFISEKYDTVKAALANGKLDPKSKAALASLVTNIVCLENLRNSRYPSVRKNAEEAHYRDLLNYERQRVSADEKVKGLIRSLNASPQALGNFIADPYKAVSQLCDSKGNPGPDYSEVAYFRKLQHDVKGFRSDLRSLPQPQSYRFSELGSELDSFNIEKEIDILSDPGQKNIVERDRAYESITNSIAKLIKPLRDNEKSLPTNPVGPDKTNLKVSSSRLIGFMQNVGAGSEYARGVGRDSREMTEAEQDELDSLNALRAQFVGMNEALKGYTVALRGHLDSNVEKRQKDFADSFKKLNNLNNMKPELDLRTIPIADKKRQQQLNEKRKKQLEEFKELREEEKKKLREGMSEDELKAMGEKELDKRAYDNALEKYEKKRLEEKQRREKQLEARKKQSRENEPEGKQQLGKDMKQPVDEKTLEKNAKLEKQIMQRLTKMSDAELKEQVIIGTRDEKEKGKLEAMTGEEIRNLLLDAMADDKLREQLREAMSEGLVSQQKRRYIQLVEEIPQYQQRLTDTKKAVMNLDDKTLRPLEKDIIYATEKMRQSEFATDPQFRDFVREFVSDSLKKAQTQISELQERMKKEPENIDKVKPFAEELERRMQAFSELSEKTLRKFAPQPEPAREAKAEQEPAAQNDAPDINISHPAEAPKSPEELAKADQMRTLQSKADGLMRSGKSKAADYFTHTNDVVKRIYKKMSDPGKGLKRTNSKFTENYESAMQKISGEIFDGKLTDRTRTALTDVVSQIVSDANLLRECSSEMKGKSTFGINSDIDDLKQAGYINDYVDSLMNSPEKLGQFIGDPVNSVHHLTDDAIQKKIEDGIPEQREQIRQCAKLLEESKTFVNSPEYKELINITKAVGKGTMFKDNKDMSEKEMFAQDLYMIHAATERYLGHKAADGVNKNAYKKLIAVERANKVLENCINKLGRTALMVNRQTNERLPGDTSKLAVSLSARQEKLRGKIDGEHIPEMKNNYAQYANDYLANNPKAANTKPDSVAESIRDADACMCKIILRAEEDANRNASASLAATRDKFLKKPFPPVDEVQKENQQKKAAAPAVLH